MLDTEKNRKKEEFRDMFETISGKRKAVNQTLILKQYVDRFKTYFNDSSMKDGYRRDWARSGFGLPMDGSMDYLFLSHAFGFNIGEWL